VMNYGYSHLDHERPIALEPAEEANRYPLQMYHHLAGSIEWEGRDALEVGSGRGGGASYVVRRFRPRSYVGLDLSRKAVDFCNAYYRRPGLSFREGNAEQLPFAEASFDIVLNVESSLYYPDISRFFAEVRRVLKPGGHFLYADMRYLEEVPAWRRQLQASGLELLSERDITANVARALALDAERKLRLIARHVPGLLRPFFRNFAGVSVPRVARGLPKKGERVYLNFLLRK